MKFLFAVHKKSCLIETTKGLCWTPNVVFAHPKTRWIKDAGNLGWIRTRHSVIREGCSKLNCPLVAIWRKLRLSRTRLLITYPIRARTYRHRFEITSSKYLHSFKCSGNKCDIICWTWHTCFLLRIHKSQRIARYSTHVSNDSRWFCHYQMEVLADLHVIAF